MYLKLSSAYFLHKNIFIVAGGGPAKPVNFSEVELAMLPLIETTAIYGVSGVRDSELCSSAAATQDVIFSSTLHQDAEPIVLQCDTQEEITPLYSEEMASNSMVQFLHVTEEEENVTLQASEVKGGKKRKLNNNTKSVLSSNVDEMLSTQKEIQKNVESIAHSMSELVGIVKKYFCAKPS